VQSQQDLFALNEISAISSETLTQFKSTSTLREPARLNAARGFEENHGEQNDAFHEK
jgi:hypothetical protein